MAKSEFPLRSATIIQFLFLLSIFSFVKDENGKREYRVWNPFRSKLAAAIHGGLEDIHMKPGSKVLYLGAASGTTVSHVSDILGPVCNIYELFIYEFI